MRGKVIVCAGEQSNLCPLNINSNLNVGARNFYLGNVSCATFDNEIPGKKKKESKPHFDTCRLPVKLFPQCCLRASEPPLLFLNRQTTISGSASSASHSIDQRLLRIKQLLCSAVIVAQGFASFPTHFLPFNIHDSVFRSRRHSFIKYERLKSHSQQEGGESFKFNFAVGLGFPLAPLSEPKLGN